MATFAPAGFSSGGGGPWAAALPALPTTSAAPTTAAASALGNLGEILDLGTCASGGLVVEWVEQDESGSRALTVQAHRVASPGGSEVPRREVGARVGP